MRTEPLVGGDPVSPPADAAARTVLCIDDNPINLKLIVSVLRLRPHWVVLAESDAHAGVAQALRHLPDLVLLDIHMPGLNGYQVLAQLRAAPSLRHTQVVAFTASATPLDVQRGMDAGFAAYLTKPFDIPQLLNTLDQLWGRPVA